MDQHPFSAPLRILVTGGAGFIGSALCRHLIRDGRHTVVNADKLTYAADLRSLASIENDPLYRFEKVDISDYGRLRNLVFGFEPDAVLHLAAETHVDRSIDNASPFIQANIVGTYNVLEAAREYWQSLRTRGQSAFRIIIVSTDEVYGSLSPGEPAFSETSNYDPSSPYAASKASADHLARAWNRTYGLPVIISNCSNNFGPYQFPEKLIPLAILNALEEVPLPVYGEGENIRDWLYVEDHARALSSLTLRGRPGEKYNIGGRGEATNLTVVETICDLVDELAPKDRSRRKLITFVPDRPGHDFRYAINSSKFEEELSWSPRETLRTGLRKTVTWYLENPSWWEPLRRNVYGGQRLGISAEAGCGPSRAVIADKTQ